MPLRLAGMAAVVLLTGCQAQNPFAAFGPARVPPPGMDSPAPYYPPTPSTIAAPPKTSSPSAGSRASISAEPTPLATAASTSIIAEAADKDPIRIVENSSPAARTATAPTRATDATRSAIPTTAAPPSASPANSPGTLAPSSGASNRYRLDQSVAPSSYQTPATSDAAPGQWRAR
jgi:hypothetical protein